MAKQGQVQDNKDKKAAGTTTTQTAQNDNKILTVLNGKAVTVENFAVEDIWVVDAETYARLDTGAEFNPVLEPDYFRSNTPYHDPERARAIMGEKLIVAEDGSKGFILHVSEKARTATAEGFFRSLHVIPGEKLFDTYETPQELKDRFAQRVTDNGYDVGELEPTFALYVCTVRPFSEIGANIAQRAVERRQAAKIGPVPKLGL